MCYPGSLGGEKEEWKKPRNALGSAGEDFEMHSRTCRATRSTPGECTEKSDEACEELEYNEEEDLGAMRIGPSRAKPWRAGQCKESYASAWN